MAHIPADQTDAPNMLAQGGVMCIMRASVHTSVRVKMGHFYWQATLFVAHRCLLNTQVGSYPTMLASQNLAVMPAGHGCTTQV